MVRAPCCEKMGLKKGPWSPEEDQILVDYIQRHGHGNWRALPKQAGLLRCGKSCRLRWTNYLRPDIKRGNFTREEEETIIKLHEMLGNRWSAIAAKLPGRTDNEIKNVWHTHLKKRLINKQNINHGSNIQESKLKQEESMESKDIDQQCSSPSDMSSSVTTSDSNNHGSTKMESGIDSIEYDDQIFPEMDESFWSEVLSGAAAEDSSTVIGDFPVVDDADLFSFSSVEIDTTMEKFHGNDNSLDFWLGFLANDVELPEI